MSKKVILVFILLTSILSLATSCVVVNGLTEYAIGVDGSGHVTQDLVYNVNGGKITFKTDGKYTTEYTGYNTTTDEQELIDGEKGTYKYDPAAYKITMKRSEYYDSTTDTWLSAVETGGYTKIETDWLLTDRNLYWAYTGSVTDGSFTFNRKYTYEDGGYFDFPTTITIGKTLDSVTFDYKDFFVYPDGQIENDPAYTSRETYEYSVNNVTPQGTVALVPGTNFSMFAYKLVYKQYEWAGSDFGATPVGENTSASTSSFGFTLSADGKKLLRAYNGTPIIGRHF